MSWNIKDLEESVLIGSTLVEGSTLTEEESRQVLSGRTIVGHPVSEMRELLNYRSSVEWLMAELRASPFLSQDLVLVFHAKLFQGFPGDHGRWKRSQNFTYRSDGSRFDYVSPAKVETEMRAWLEKYNSSEVFSQTLDASSALAALYYEFQKIHPFEDGNGRIGRVLLAYWLHWKAGRLFTFRLRDKLDHLRALEAANQGDLRMLESFFRERMRGE